MRAYVYRLNTKIRVTILCLSGFELYSRWVPLKQTKRVETTGAIVKRIIETFYYYFLSLNGSQAKSQEIWPLRGFFTILMILAELHPDKVLLFRRCQQSVSRVSSQKKQWKFRSQKLTLHLINGEERSVYKN